MTLKNNENIYDVANHLAELVKETPEYIQYMTAKEKLDADEVNKQILMDLRLQSMKLESSETPDPDFEKKEQLLNEVLMSLSLNPVVGDFLNAEYSFGKVVSSIGKIFDDVFPVEIPVEDAEDDILERIQMASNDEENITYLS